MVLIFALKLVEFCSKVTVNLMYENVDTLMDVPSLRCLGSEHFIRPNCSNVVLVRNEEEYGDSYLTNVTNTWDSPAATCPLPCTAKLKRMNFNELAILDPPTHPTIDLFNFESGMSTNRSHGNSKSSGRYTRPRDQNNKRAMGDFRPIIANLPRGALRLNPFGAPALPVNANNGNPNNLRGPHALAVELPGGGFDYEAPNNRIATFHQSQPGDLVDVLDIVGPRAYNPVMLSEPLLNLAAIIVDRRKREGIGYDWANHVAEGPVNSNAQTVFHSLKKRNQLYGVCPAMPAVRTKTLDNSVFKVSGKIDSAQMQTLKVYFRNKSIDLTPQKEPSDIFRSAMFAGLRTLIMEKIGASQIVLVMGDNATDYNVDGYVQYSSFEKFGMFENEHEIYEDIARNKTEGRVFMVEETPLTQTMNRYDEMIVFFPYSINLSTLAYHAARLGVKRIHVITSRSYDAYQQKVGTLLNICCHYCNEDNYVEYTSFEEDGNSWKLRKDFVKEYNETSVITLNKYLFYICKRYQVTEDIVYSVYTISNRVSSAKSVEHLDGTAFSNYALITSIDSTSNGCLTIREKCQVFVIPKTLLTGLFGQTYRQKEPNPNTTDTTCTYVEAGTNRNLHCNLQSMNTSNNKSSSIMEMVIDLSKRQKEKEDANEISQQRFPVLSRMELFGKADATQKADYLRLHSHYCISDWIIDTMSLSVPFNGLPFPELVPLDSYGRLVDAEEDILVPPGFKSVYELLNDDHVIQSRENSLQGWIYPNTEVNNTVLARDVLGLPTNDLEKEKPPDFKFIKKTLGQYGYYYLSHNWYLESCLYKNCFMNYLGGDMPAYEAMLSTQIIVLIKNNVFTVTRKIEIDNTTDYKVIQITEDGKHLLYEVDEPFSSFSKSTIKSLIEVPYNGILNFLSYAQLDLVSASTKFCFYEAAGYSNVNEVAGSDSSCTPGKVRLLCILQGICILRGKDVYLPKGWNPRTLRNAVVVIETHAYFCDLSSLLADLSVFNLVSMDGWSTAVNGPVDQTDLQTPAENYILPTDLESNASHKLIKMINLLNEKMVIHKNSYRRSAILEYLLYCAHSHLNIISNFELIQLEEESTYLRGLVTHSAYNMITQSFISKTKMKNKEYAWDGEKLINVFWDKKKERYIAETNSPIIILTEDEKFLKYGKILEKFIPK